MPEHIHVYILASGYKHLYIGMTAHLERRIEQHKTGAHAGSFTDRYNIRQLVYFERYTLLTSAIAREKQLKRWSRVKKIRLIVAHNPTWHDLSLDWTALVAPPTPQDAYHPDRSRTASPSCAAEGIRLPRHTPQ